MLQVNMYDATTSLSSLIQKVMEGEEVVIAKDDQPVAKLVPFYTLKPKRKLGTAKGKIKMAPDFDEPLEDFKDYM